MKINGTRLYKSDLRFLKIAVKYGRVLGIKEGLKTHKDIPAPNACRLCDAGLLTRPIADWWHVYEPTNEGVRIAG